MGGLPQHYLSNNPNFCISALKRYTQWDFITLVEKYKIPYEQRKHGQLFCLDSAKDILNMLLSECQKTGVNIKTHCEIKQVQPLQKPVESANGARFVVKTSLGDFTCASVVVATGALSIPSMGASGFGYELARSFGHRVVATRAGLVPFTFSDGFKSISESLSGLAIDCDLSCEDAQFKEAVLFTHRGLSGPAALQLSNYWQTGQDIKIDLFPDMSLDMAQQWIRELKSIHPKNVLRTVLNGVLAKNLVLELQCVLWPDFAETPLAQIPDAVLVGIVNHLKAWVQKPSGTEGYRTAEVTLGGVDTNELSSKTMESKLQTGLYFIGEVVDVTGHLGGYNFQWAWASGAAAGRAI